MSHLSRFLPWACLVLQVLPAYGLSLTEAVQMARQSDPAYLAAQAGQSGSNERRLQAQAALLPQVSISGTYNGVRRKYITRESPIPTAHDNYDNSSAQITVNQPIWRTASRAALTQANAALSQAEYQLLAAEQDLLVRLVQAWFDLMLARDAAIAAQSQVQATEFQLALTERAQKNGLAAPLNTAEARMKHQQAHADWISAQTEQTVKLAALEQITGPLGEMQPPSLSDRFVAEDPRKLTLEQWLQRAEAESPAVLAARHGVNAAQEEIRKQRGGHEPTLDFVASFGRNQQEAGGFPGQNGSDVRQRSLGIQLNIPIYSSGAISAKVREAIAMRSKAEAELENARRTARFNAKTAWNVWQASHAREEAAQQAVAYWRENLKAANTGQATGLKSGLDVLQAAQQLYAGLRDQQKARYDKVTSFLKLKSVLGQLEVHDVASFDRWFEAGQSLPGGKS